MKTELEKVRDRMRCLAAEIGLSGVPVWSDALDTIADDLHAIIEQIGEQNEGAEHEWHQSAKRAIAAEMAARNRGGVLAQPSKPDGWIIRKHHNGIEVGNDDIDVGVFVYTPGKTKRQTIAGDTLWHLSNAMIAAAQEGE